MMKMDMDQQIKKISKAQKDKKLKDEEEMMRKKQEILAKALGTTPKDQQFPSS